MKRKSFILTAMDQVPLFSLPVVFFPGTVKPLQVFELRYRRMVKNCLASETGFIIPYTRNYGSENPAISAIATYGEITDWEPLPNEMIGIYVHGLMKVRITDAGVEPDGLITASAELIEPEPETLLSEQDRDQADIFRRLKEHPLVSLLPLKFDAGNALNISYQLADLLPFTTAQKQQLLELSGPAERLEQILQLLKEP